MDDDICKSQQQDYWHSILGELVFLSPKLLITLNLCSQRCDTDGNGKLDYQEFKEMIFRSKARKEEAIKEEEKEIKKKGKVVKKEATKKGKKSKGKK